MSNAAYSLKDNIAEHSNICIPREISRKDKKYSPDAADPLIQLKY
jgi:hypothetical protein